MSNDLPFDCEEIFNDTLKNIDPSNMEKFNSSLNKVNDVIKTVLSGLKDEITPIAITIGVEIGLTGTAWILKKIIKKAVTRLLFAFVKGGFNILDAMQLAEMGVTLIRGLSETTLNVRIDKDMITNGINGAFESWNEELNKNRTINCMRTNFLSYLRKNNPTINYTQEYVTELLNNLFAIYKVVRVLNSLDFPDDIMECWPCAGIKKIIGEDGKETYDVSTTYIPQSCYITPDNKFNIGIPTDKCNPVYREKFQKYMTERYEVLRPGTFNYSDYEWYNSKEEYNDSCSPTNPEYGFCIRGDITGCKVCINAPRRSNRQIVQAASSSNKPNLEEEDKSFNFKKIFIIFLLIIIISFILYYIIKNGSNTQDIR